MTKTDKNVCFTPKRQMRRFFAYAQNDGVGVLRFLKDLCEKTALRNDITSVTLRSIFPATKGLLKVIPSDCGNPELS